MNEVKLPIVKPGELIKALEKLGFSCTRKSKEVISGIDIRMEERRQSLSTREKT